ncbi:SagB family peptide dehydrogenase [Paenibacillus thalictri]|uniref:SagB/ThcOx family dehydrogenase n=1 Tax=Paenibacillus thalictri TaxID=2527873 RepID=A0A4Q9DL92_9BACL|nr:SagB family peptide dehydrogenase [Paenibacillus thalictri]TBL75706.1 SagB/ThcOx family dehydrogenase [Paenibacillus thalictri]
MNPQDFIRSLHSDASESRGPLEEIDWEDAPLKYKLYRNLPVIPLSPEVPLTLKDRKPPSKPNLAEIGHFLWYVYGLGRVSHSVPGAGYPGALSPMQMYRRFVPSGGGLYPSELYIYLKLDEAPSGVYHYDAAHHRLILLREGNFDDYVARALGDRCDVSRCYGAVFVTTMFWKNFFKYKNFAYRLQGLDAGVLIGQLLETANRFGSSPGVYYQFLDQAMNRLLGVSEHEESVYAVIPLADKPDIEWFGGSRAETRMFSADQLCRELPDIRHEHYMKSRKVKEYPMLLRMNEASALESPSSFRTSVEAVNCRDSGLRAVYLPAVGRLPYDLAEVCRQRYSPETEYVLGRVTAEQLAALLQEVAASFAYRNDLDGRDVRPEPRVSIHVCLYHVEGIPDGAYRYDFTTHALRPERPGDHRLQLQQAMLLHNVNLFQVPISLHIACDNRYLTSVLGPRGYRIQQMEAGILVQRILLAASASGMGGRPLLGFQTSRCDEIYGLGELGQTALIQIPIGPHGKRTCLEGGLHS